MAVNPKVLRGYDILSRAPDVLEDRISVHRRVLVAGSGEKLINWTSWLAPPFAPGLPAGSQTRRGQRRMSMDLPLPSRCIRHVQRPCHFRHLSPSSGCHRSESFTPGARSLTPQSCWPQRGQRYRAPHVPIQSNALKRLRFAGEACVIPVRQSPFAGPSPIGRQIRCASLNARVGLRWRVAELPLMMPSRILLGPVGTDLLSTPQFSGRFPRTARHHPAVLEKSASAVPRHGRWVRGSNVLLASFSESLPCCFPGFLCDRSPTICLTSTLFLGPLLVSIAALARHLTCICPALVGIHMWFICAWVATSGLSAWRTRMDSSAEACNRTSIEGQSQDSTIESKCRLTGVRLNFV